MSNTCKNEFYAYSTNKRNIKHIKKYISEHFNCDFEEDCDCVDSVFTSELQFPEKEMNEMFKGLPDKNNISMRCLSNEKQNNYIDYHKCEGLPGWKSDMK